MTRRYLSALAALALLALNTPARGQEILSKLLAPGPLSEGHKELESSSCFKCHDGGKGVPNSKCLDCHKDIARAVEQRHGFHGLTLAACVQCHQDHKGRDFDSAPVDDKKFDHAKTGFSLEGKHGNLKCSECHRQKASATHQRYFGNAGTCVSCHKKDDVHFFRGKWAGKDCNTCHGVRSWQAGVRFDHMSSTGYALEGHHQDLKCSECHKIDKGSKTGLYQWSKLKTAQCLTCHQDVHKHNLSPRFQNGACTKCHNQDQWKIEGFDHAVVSLPLRGRHAQITCTQCHKQPPQSVHLKPQSYVWHGLNKQCSTCHNDYHLYGKLKLKGIGELNACEKCHTETNWKQTHNFDHNVQTKYPLDGKHLDLKCNDCHVSTKNADVSSKPNKSQYLWPKLAQNTCENCHKSPHVGVFSAALLAKKCTDCHVTDGWRFDKNRKSFDHSQTRFALTGKHGVLTCNACHLVNQKKVFKFDSVDLKFCVDCHKTPHQGQFDKPFSNQSCASCHSTESFVKRPAFDHDQPRFKLRGKHASLQCSECHKETGARFATKIASPQHRFIFSELSEKSCTTCHQDYHRGQLGPSCARCHNEKSWKPSQFDHNRDSHFALKDKHQNVKCELCHRPMRGQFVDFAGVRKPVISYKGTSSRCVDCHRDAHGGSLGTACQECHTTQGWKAAKEFHRNFSLHGVHFTLSCEECHKQDRRLSGLSEQCLVCHQKDDVHSGSLPDCGSCHTQQMWEYTNFRHSMSFFPLRGVHRTLSCAQCHSGGIYRGTPTQCQSCHSADAQAVLSPTHNTPAFTDCKNCHNQFAF